MGSKVPHTLVGRDRVMGECQGDVFESDQMGWIRVMWGGEEVRSADCNEWDCEDSTPRYVIGGGIHHSARQVPRKRALLSVSDSD